MSEDEVIVTLIALVAGPVWWTITLIRLARVGPLRPGAQAVAALTVTVSVCATAILFVLKTLASFDVVGAPEYQFMYGVLGLAWLRIGERFFAFAGLSVRDDLVERRNGAAIPAMAGAFVGLTCCYAGGNIGDGPGWWVVVFSAGLASALLFVAWLMLAQFSPVMDAITIDRDPAAGVRLGVFLAAGGLLLGRCAAGDWYSVADTIGDVASGIPALGVMLVVALIVERLAHPTPQRPRAPLVSLGLVPAVFYVAIAVAALSAMEWPADGWRISEANCDVPGGLNEASGLPVAIGRHYAWAKPVGDPADAYARALAAQTASPAAVALVHATAFSDDQQMMLFVARRLEAMGITAHLASPSHLRWRDGRAHLEADWWRGPLDLVVRFFPAEWLDGLPGACGWSLLFAGARTPLSNPATAMLTQSKRFPLVWDRLRTPLPAWRAHLPETRDPRDAPWRTSSAWIVKPAFGRVGEGIGIPDVTGQTELRRIRRQARWWPGNWVAQRRFQVVPLGIGGRDVFPCLGVYALDGRVVGAYGRLGRVPLIDARAADAAVLAA